MFTLADYDGHEKVQLVSDEKTELEAIIAIHNTRLGPAAGGCRMFPYPEPIDALNDSLRLSRGMTYKNAMAGLPLGGGKAVIIADPTKLSEQERLDLFAAFGRKVQELHGEYWTSIDVGTTTNDILQAGNYTDYTFGTDSQVANKTALGGFYSLKAVVKKLFDTESLLGRSFAIQGLGQTGSKLAKMLLNAGATVYGSDLNPICGGLIQRYVYDILSGQATFIEMKPERIIDAPAEVFVPCAMGGILTYDLIDQFRFKAVCGLANNQLDHPLVGYRLFKKNILYAPDYVVNAGGVIHASNDIHQRNYGDEKIRAIADTLNEIWTKSETDMTAPSYIADRITKTKLGYI